LVDLNIFNRRKSFLNRSSGQLISVLIAASLLAVLFPLSSLYTVYHNENDILKLEARNHRIQEISLKFEKDLSCLNEEKSNMLKVTDSLSTRYDTKSQLISQLYDKRKNYKSRSHYLVLFAEAVEKFDVKMEFFKSKNKIVWVKFKSDNTRYITQVMQYISNMEEIKRIKIEGIQKDLNNSDYSGVIKVKFI